jgi:hypothetical protein
MYDPDREARYDAKVERTLLELLGHKDFDQRRGAAYCLGDVKAPSPETLSASTTCARHQRSSTQRLRDLRRE